MKIFFMLILFKFYYYMYIHIHEHCTTNEFFRTKKN